MASSRDSIASNILAAAPRRPFSNASSARDSVSGRKFLTGLVRRPSARRYEFADMGCAFMGAQYRILTACANLLWDFWIRRKFLKFLRGGCENFNCQIFFRRIFVERPGGYFKIAHMICFNCRFLAEIAAIACFCSAGCAFADGEGAPEKPVKDAVSAPVESPRYALSDYRNFFGMCWSADSNADLLDYARQMGHTHVIYRKNMENMPQAKGMKFFIEDPEFGARRRMLDYDKEYSQAEIDDIQSHYVVIYHDKEFPHNMASSWFAAG